MGFSLEPSMKVGYIFIILYWHPNIHTNCQILSLGDFPFCQRDLLIVYLSNITLEWHLDQAPFHIDLSVLDTGSFLDMTAADFQRIPPHCLLILQNFSDISQKTVIPHDAELKAKTLVEALNTFRQPKTIVIFINYVSISSLNKQDQRDYLLNSQKQNPTQINLDFYYLYASMDNKLMYAWESYTVKGVPKINEFYSSTLNDSKNKFIECISSTLTNKALRRKDFSSISIVGIVRVKDKKLVLTSGFSVNIYWDMKLMLNFSEVAVIGDGVKTLANQTLGGKTVSLLKSGKADISLSQSSLVPFRARQLTFLHPTYSGLIHIFFKQPVANSIRNIVTAPFKTSLWIVLICTWIFFVMGVKCSYLLQQYIYSKMLQRSSASSHPYFEVIQNENDRQFASQIAMWTFAANCQKSWHCIPNSCSMRLMFLMGLFCGVVTYVAYSGAIVSTLAVTVVPVKQFMQLIHFGFTFTVHEWSEPFQVFLKSLITQYNLPQEVHKISTEVEISHLLNPKKPAAFFTYPDAFYSAAPQLNYTPQFICKNIYQIVFSHVPATSGLFLKKGSPFTEIFNHKILMIKERGLNFRYINRYETKTSISCLETDSAQNFDPVTFTDVFTAFLVICFGLGISFVLSFIEHLFLKGTPKQLTSYNSDQIQH